MAKNGSQEKWLNFIDESVRSLQQKGILIKFQSENQRAIEKF